MAASPKQTPPGAFVASEHRDDCARFLSEVRELAARRAARLAVGSARARPDEPQARAGA